MVGQPYVITDIHKCEPQVVIACGAKVVKSLFNDKTKLSSIRGNVVEFSTGKYFTRDFKTLVIPTESPASFSMGYGDIEVFRSELKRADVHRRAKRWIKGIPKIFIYLPKITRPPPGTGQWGPSRYFIVKMDCRSLRHKFSG